MIVVLVRAVDGHLPPTWQALAGCNSVQPTRVETRRAHVDWAHVIAEPFVPTSDDLLGASTFVLGGLLLARDNKVGQLCSLRKTILEQEQDAKYLRHSSSGAQLAECAGGVQEWEGPLSAHADHLVLESGDVVLPRLLAPLLGILRWRAGGSGAGGARAAAIRNRNEIVQIAVKSLTKP